MTTESDRELLELAAKAAGIHIVPCTCSDKRWPFKHDEARSGKHGHWNPLVDDGDALRLAVKLHIGVRPHGPGHWQQSNVTVALWDFGEQAGRVTVAHGDDSQRATRRAIVRAAAEIARATHKEQT